LMVGPFGELLLMDWGVAKVLAEAGTSLGSDHAATSVRSPPSPTTGHGVVLGTPGYMAPEQATGDPALVDARADVYAIGAILRDLCATADGTAPGISATRARPLRAIILKAMTANPADRYADVTSLARDVAAFRAGESVGAYEENIWERTRRVAIRYRTPILLVGAYLMMRITLLAFFGR
jgi:eukaryotic-like serine/threonine-protein kinase